MGVHTSIVLHGVRAATGVRDWIMRRLLLGLCITLARLYPWTHRPGQEIEVRKPVFSFVCILPCFLRSNRLNFESEVYIRTMF